MVRRILIYGLWILITTVGCKKDPNGILPPGPGIDSFIRAVDISSLPDIQAAGTSFKDQGGQARPVLNILKDAGVNTIRLRLWVNPDSTNSSISEVSLFCEELQQEGFKIWLSIHYSDTWADPGHQNKPSRWSSSSYQELLDSVYQYTSQVAGIIKPEIIQIGNEINNGFLYPDGSYNNSVQFHQLLQQGIQATRAASPTSQIMIHYAGHEFAQSFFSKIDSLDYDLIGLSYYPIWHGKDLDSLAQSIDRLGSQFNRDVMIAETAYPFTLGFNDWTNNIVGLPEQLLTEYPASPKGQKDFLVSIRKLITESTRGAGFCYWGAELVAWKGPQSTSGSPWENQALWDFNNKALPALEVFEKDL